MYFGGLMHRDELYEIAMRWLYDELDVLDGRRLTEIFLYESMVTAPTVQRLMLDFYRRAYGSVRVERVQFKQFLRERIIDACPEHDPRTRELCDDYLAHPEEFFPRLPVDGMLMSTDDGRVVGLSRIKRTQRIAEKAAYRMADALAEEIRREAEAIASARAVSEGKTLGELISTDREMKQDFLAAERAVAYGFRDRKLSLAQGDLTINDLIGFKIVGDQAEQDRAEELLGSQPGMQIVDREVHRGHYNATNLLVEVELPPLAQLVEHAAQLDWSLAAIRGLDPEEAKRNFQTYMERGSRRVHIEVILTTYPELLESELGRSLHELRILRLRERVPYQGRIADNARYLIEYLLAVAYSPTTLVPDLPIKMWGRYLPEVLLAAIRQLHGMEPSSILLRSFVPPMDLADQLSQTGETA